MFDKVTRFTRVNSHTSLLDTISSLDLVCNNIIHCNENDECGTNHHTAIATYWDGIALGFIHVLTGPDHLSVNKVITVTMESFRLISSRSAFRIR